MAQRAALGSFALARFGLTSVVDGGGEELNDVEPVHGDRGVGEALSESGEESRRHVADHLGDGGRLAAVAQQEGTELGHASLALARRHEDDGFDAAIHVDEHGDVFMATLGGGFVETDGAHRPQVERGNGTMNIVPNDAPQPLVGDADEARRGQHRHLAHQNERRLLEQQRKSAARPRPRHHHPFDPVGLAVDPRHPRRDEAVVLEEVKMLPSEGGEVVRLASPPALRAGKHCAAIRDHLEMQFMRPLFGVQTLAGKFPWRTQAKTEREYILCFHPRPHAPTTSAWMPHSQGSTDARFHSERRGG